MSCFKTNCTKPWIVGVGAAHEELVGVRLGEDPDVVVAVVLALPLHQAQLRVPLTRVPRDPLLQVLLPPNNQSVKHKSEALKH